MDIAIQITKAGDTDVLQYAGPINEESEVHFTNLLTTLGKNVCVDFSKVSTVNSCGVRAWINFLRNLEKDRAIKFVKLHPGNRNSDEYDSEFQGICQSYIGVRILHLSCVLESATRTLRSR